MEESAIKPDNNDVWGLGDARDSLNTRGDRVLEADADAS